MNPLIFETQSTYRTLLDSLARPGQIHQLAANHQYHTQLKDQTMEILFCLLDAEVTFHLMGNDKQTENEITLRTLAQTSDAATADFIIVPEDHSDFIEALNVGKIGSLIDPDQSALVIYETSHLSLDAGTLKYELSGPGIETTHSISFNAPSDWLAAFQVRNIEFPKGLDLIITDSQQVIGITRTTSIKEA